MSNIFSRSPYIIEIDEVGQTASKIELFIWNGTGSAPTDPQYVLTKNIPASNNTQTLYNISPYVREFISHISFQNLYNTNTNTTSSQWCNVIVKRYKYTGTYSLLDTTQYKAFDGYGYYNEEYNPDLGNIHLDEGTYYYWLNSPSDPNTNLNERGGQISINAGVGWYVKHTGLVSGTQTTTNLANNEFRSIFRVHPSRYAEGNRLDIYDSGNNLLWQGYFKPLEECKYTPIVCDYVNKYGAWSRIWFFKANNKTVNIEQVDYNLMQSNLVNYSVKEGQRKTFNTNGKDSIKVNTGWVYEEFNEQLKQLMLSETIWLDSKPVKLITKSTELFQNINTNLINYALEFEYTYDIINSVI